MTPQPSLRQKVRRGALVCISLLAAPAFLATNAQAQNVSNDTGSVILVAGPSCPTDSLEANGQLLSIADNPALYSLLATKFGGDGHTTFGVPNLNANVPQTGMRYCIITNGIFPTRP